MERRPFQYGPRDNGPFNPPPWPQLVITAIGLILCFTAGYIGCNYEWIAGVYVRGPAAFLCIIGLMFPLCFVGDGFDKARAAGEMQDGEH